MSKYICWHGLDMDNNFKRFSWMFVSASLQYGIVCFKITFWVCVWIKIKRVISWIKKGHPWCSTLPYRPRIILKQSTGKQGSLRYLAVLWAISIFHVCSLLSNFVEHIWITFCSVWAAFHVQYLVVQRFLNCFCVCIVLIDYCIGVCCLLTTVSSAFFLCVLRS